MQRTLLTQNERKIQAKTAHVQTTFERVVRGFQLPGGIRHSQVTTMAKTVLKRGITHEIEIAAKRDRRGWKRELVKQLTGRTIFESMTYREPKQAPKYVNLTFDGELSKSEQQRIVGLFVAKKFSEVLAEMSENPDVAKYVEYLRDYSGDGAIRAKARELLNINDTAQDAEITVESIRLHDEMVQIVEGRSQTGERMLKQEATSLTETPMVTEPQAVTKALWQMKIEAELSMMMFDLVVKNMKTFEASRKYVYHLKEHGAEGFNDLKKEAARAVEIFERENLPTAPQENADGQLTSSEKQSIAGKLRGNDNAKMQLQIFGQSGNVILGNNPHTDAVVEYVKWLHRNSTSAKVQANAASILANANAL